MRNIKYILFLALTVILLNACAPADGNHPGSEYIPDMAHSVAYEANIFNYYRFNTWDSMSVVKLKPLSNPFLPVNGTVPRGYAGVYFADGMEQKMEVMDQLHGEESLNAISVPINGKVPFYYDDTEEDRARATAEITDNPFPITEEGLSHGKKLYDINCGICHGSKGNGVGYLVSEDNPNAKYPAAPANFLLDEFLNASNGRYYFSIMYGKNVMGAYSDKLSYKERWEVIHYIRKLQADDKKLEYSEEANTLNPAFGTPASQLGALASNKTDDAPAMDESGSPKPEVEGQSENDTPDGEEESNDSGSDH